jgi:hypothetical protein
MTRNGASYPVAANAELPSERVVGRAGEAAVPGDGNDTVGADTVGASTVFTGVTVRATVQERAEPTPVPVTV